MDFGAFELMPDSAITAVDLRAGPEEAGPLIHYGDFPVHSVHHQTVKTETAVLSLLSTADALLSNRLPPFVVNDNYCFVVDAAAIPMDAIAGDDKYWRHTSRPTKYYYSDDLKHFQKVNVILSRNKIHSARFPKTPQAALTLDDGASANLSASAPAASLSPGPGPGALRRDEDAPLANVFKVIRFYSFWKTCTSFHRIVTLVDPVLENDATALVKKRLFIQYLWRNAKESDKLRVANEFDPKGQLMGGDASSKRAARLVKSPSSSSSTASTAPSTSRGPVARGRRAPAPGRRTPSTSSAPSPKPGSSPRSSITPKPKARK